MKRSILSPLCCLLVGLLCVIYLVMCPGINAFATSVQYTQMSTADTRDLLGRNLNCNFRAQNQDWSGTFVYSGAWSNASSAFRGGWNVDSNVPSYTAMSSYGICTWVLDVSNYNLGGTTYLSLEIPIYIHASGGFRTMFFCSSSQFDGTMNPVSDFNLRALGGNYISASPSSFEACSANYQATSALSDYYGIVAANASDTGYYCEMRPIYVDGVNITLETIHFNSLLFQSGKIYLYMLTPYTYGDVSNVRPVETTTTSTSLPSSTTEINVNVDVDMTETNGILSGIKQGIDNIVTGIINGLKALFIPSDDFMDDFKSDMEDLAEDHLGGLYEAESILVDMFEQFPEVASKNEIYIEPVNIPLAGETLTLGNWHVPLKVAGIPTIFYDGLAFIIDFLCLMAFLRMCRNKLEIFLNPDTEVIKE